MSLFLLTSRTEAANRAGMIVMFCDQGTGVQRRTFPDNFTPSLFWQPPIGIAFLLMRPISLPVRSD
jgi:hypothetical protein